MTTTISDDFRQAIESALRLRQAYEDGKELRFQAVCHTDQNPSARWNRDKATWFCDVCKIGGGYMDLAQRLGLSVAHEGNGQHARKIVKTYAYTDEHGTLLYQVVRYKPKDFRQRRPDGHGGWIWNLNDVRRVCYRLPECLGHARVYICEGEEDVDRLWSLALAATCNAGGAGKWTDDLTQQLKAAGVKEVIILPDNDDPGRQHAESVAQSCVAAGLAAKIVTLPNLPPKGDVSDYFDTGGTIDALHVLVDTAPPWVPGEKTRELTQDDRPELDCDIGDLDALTTQAWMIVAAHNRPELLYRHGTLAVRLEADEHGGPDWLNSPMLVYGTRSRAWLNVRKQNAHHSVPIPSDAKIVSRRWTWSATCSALRRARSHYPSCAESSRCRSSPRPVSSSKSPAMIQTAT